MPEPISLISSADIKPEEFSRFLQQSGAILNPDDVYDGRLSKENLHVWIALDNSELRNFEAGEIARITQQLAGVPKTHILLDISKTLGSQQLAIKFACMFAEQWPCVMYDLSQRVYSTRQLLDLCRSGQEQNNQPVWELFGEFTKDLPDEVLAQLPTDGAEQHDHYLYGVPKKQS